MTTRFPPPPRTRIDDLDATGRSVIRGDGPAPPPPPLAPGWALVDPALVDGSAPGGDGTKTDYNDEDDLFVP